MSQFDIWSLDLHEGMSIADGKSLFVFVLRVPGGWLYIHHRNASEQGIFVPFVKKEDWNK